MADLGLDDVLNQLSDDLEDETNLSPHDDCSQSESDSPPATSYQSDRRSLSLQPRTPDEKQKVLDRPILDLEINWGLNVLLARDT